MAQSRRRRRLECLGKHSARGGGRCGTEAAGALRRQRLGSRARRQVAMHERVCTAAGATAVTRQRTCSERGECGSRGREGGWRHQQACDAACARRRAVAAVRCHRRRGARRSASGAGVATRGNRAAKRRCPRAPKWCALVQVRQWPQAPRVLPPMTSMASEKRGWRRSGSQRAKRRGLACAFWRATPKPRAPAAAAAQRGAVRPGAHVRGARGARTGRRPAGVLRQV